MRDSNTEIRRAVEIGEANKKTLELVHNWCRHVETKRVGGVGLIEQQTGLPIGMRGLSCPHATKSGMAAMVVEPVALEFYDANCVGCTKREPVRIPNFSEVVARRDEKKRKSDALTAKAHDVERAAFDARHAERDRLARGADAAKRSLFERLDAFDLEPIPERATVLMESLRAVPESFDVDVQSALFALVPLGGQRARTALELLAAVATDRDRLAQAALQVLAGGEMPTLAIGLIGERLRKLPDEQVRSILPPLFELAAPRRVLFGATPSADAEPLKQAWEASPQAVRELLAALLESDDKNARILACRVAVLILAESPDTALQLARLLLRSVGKPDDGYDEGPASDAIARFLGVALEARLNEVDAHLHGELQVADEERRAVIIDGYIAALRRENVTDAPSVEPTPTEALCFQRVVHILATRRDDEAFGSAVEFMRYRADAHPTLIERHAETLLGIAALLQQDAKERYSPLLDPRPTPMKAFEANTRRMNLISAAHQIIEAIARVARRSPARTGALIVRTLAELPEGEAELQASLVSALGETAGSEAGLALVTPAIYAALMSSEALVRAAGASAYKSAAARDPEGLPRLMHEAFLLLLRDPYLVVHRAAVRALFQARIPKDLRPKATRFVWNIVCVHTREGGDEQILEDAIDAFLRLAPETLDPSVRSALNGLLIAFPKPIASKLLRHHDKALAGVPEFADALVRSLEVRDPSASSGRDPLLKSLALVPRADLDRVAVELIAAARKMHPGWGAHSLERILAVTTDAEAWGVAEQVAAAPLAELANVPRDQALRSIVNIRLLALRIERAVAASEIDAARRLAREWQPATSPLLVERPDVGDKWPLVAVYSARVLTLLTLADTSKGFATSASALRTVAGRLGDKRASAAYAMLARVVDALAHAVRWGTAVREAEQDADRFLRAAKQAARDIKRSFAEGGLTRGSAERLKRAIEAIEAVTEPDDVPSALDAASLVTLPFSFERPPPTWRPGEPADVTGATKDTPPRPVVFLQFSVDGRRLDDPHVITPDELHDLDVVVRASQWPVGFRLVLEPVTVEPSPQIGELPRFALERPTGGPPLETRQHGRMLIRIPQPIAARPLEFVYRAYFEQDQKVEITLEGERRLRVRSHDPQRNPVTGFAQVDLKLLEIRDSLRAYGGLRDVEVDAFLLVLGGLGQLAGEALQDKTFPGKIAESELQRRVRERLRLHPRIGAELLDHVHAAGGIMDLAFRGITIELKVEPDSFVTPTSVAAFSQQAAQYTAGNDRRLGLLCVLDCSDKTAAPGSVANDIFLREVPAPGGAGGLPLVLGVVILRGNLPRPSDLSR